MSFIDMMTGRKELLEKIRYSKKYGWDLIDEDNDKMSAGITVIETVMGYCVFEQLESTTPLFFSRELDAAIEFAVDHARKMIEKGKGQ